MYLHVARSLQSIVSSETVSEASVSSLMLKRNTLFEELGCPLGTPSEAEQGTSYGNELSRRVCIILAEAWCLFRKMNFSSTEVESLGYCPNTSDLQRFWKLCEQQLKISATTPSRRLRVKQVAWGRTFTNPDKSPQKWFKEYSKKRTMNTRELIVTRKRKNDEELCSQSSVTEKFKN